MVCLGNICRSPLAEEILRKKLSIAKVKNVMVDSAGTAGFHIGEHPDKRSTENALRHGIDISKHLGRQFSVHDFDDFEVIYVMDHSNQKDVLIKARNEHDRSKVRLILNESYPGEDRPVPDPYFGGEEGFELVYNLLDEACEVISAKFK
jgi:protein-tyrosine phosphatase